MSEVEINVKNLSPELKNAKKKLEEKLINLNKTLSNENLKYVKKIFEKTLENENTKLIKNKDKLKDDILDNNIINLN